MAFSVVASDLYAHAAPEAYFGEAGVSSEAITKALLASLGTCTRKLRPRVGGPASSWSFSDDAGREDAARDVCIHAFAALALAFGLTLPGEGADPQYLARARAVDERWSRMGTPGGADPSKAEPLYEGLVDATPLVTEGAPRGWSSNPGMVPDSGEV